MAFYYFLKFADEQSQPTDILGASRDAKHPGWIEILSFSWGSTAPATVGGPGTRKGKSDLPQDLFFSTADGAASVGISRACSFGKHFPTVVLEATIDGHVAMKVVMSDAYVATFGSSLGSDGARYQFSLNTPSVETILFGPAPTPPAAPVILRPPSPGRSAGNASGGKGAAHVRHGR